MQYDMDYPLTLLNQESFYKSCICVKSVVLSNRLIIKIKISSNLIGSFIQFFLNLISRECPITKCCYWKPVIGQLNKPITTRAPGFLTNQQIVTIVVSSPPMVVMIITVMVSRVVIALATMM